MRSIGQIRILCVLAVSLLVPAVLAAPASAASGTGEVYVIHGLSDTVADIVVDGEVVIEDAEPKTIAGPLELSAGEHVIELREPEGGTPMLSARVDVEAGSSVDLVAHRRSNPQQEPVLTVFPNDLSPVAPGRARLVVAHTAAVPPADILVDGEVLFSNVANAESLSLVVPEDVYTVAIVPAAAEGPVVYGPVDLEVEAGALNRVFAFGDPAEGTMDAVVQTLPLPVEGAATPSRVETGTGGQAADEGGSIVLPGTAAAVALLGLLVLALRRTRRPVQPL